MASKALSGRWVWFPSVIIADFRTSSSGSFVTLAITQVRTYCGKGSAVKVEDGFHLLRLSNLRC